MAQHVGGALLAAQLEIAVLWREPSVEHLGDLDDPLAQMKAARRLLAPVTRVTLDLDYYIRVRMGRFHDHTLELWPGPRGAFLCDEMLQGLGRWLRAAGHDTAVAEPGQADSDLLQWAGAEARLLLTCDRELAARAAPRVAVLTLPAEGLDAGARRLSADLGLDWLHAPFSRCLLDNTVLRPASARERRALPAKARGLDGPVTACPGCARLYWPGSHVRRMRARLETWQETTWRAA